MSFCKEKNTWSLNCGNLKPTKWSPYPSAQPCPRRVKNTMAPVREGYVRPESYMSAKRTWGVNQKPYTL